MGDANDKSLSNCANLQLSLTLQQDQGQLKIEHFTSPAEVEQDLEVTSSDTTPQMRDPSFPKSFKGTMELQ